VVREGGVLKSTNPPDLYAVINKGDQILTNVVNISKSLDQFTSEFATPENRENFSQTFRSMRNIVTEVEKGDGFLHSVIYKQARVGWTTCRRGRLHAIPGPRDGKERGDRSDSRPRWPT
jgi:hypothetical protein